MVFALLCNLLAESNLNTNNQLEPNCNLMKKKNVIKDLIVLWIALGALGCAAVNLHISLNMLGKKNSSDT